MTFHMLRRRVGDEVYVRGLQRFYREQRGKRASFADLARAHGAAAKTDLLPFMSQWVQRAGTLHPLTHEGQQISLGGSTVGAGEISETCTLAALLTIKALQTAHIDFIADTSTQHVKSHQRLAVADCLGGRPPRQSATARR